MVFKRVHLGYGVIRTYRTPPRPGSGMCAYPHRIYPTRGAAVDALVMWECGGYDGGMFSYDVVDVVLEYV